MTRILVIDDDRGILRLIERTLQKEGYDVTTVEDPEKLEMDHLNQYQLILLDVMMPGIDGFTLCEKIRDKVDCPILFVTAKSEEKDLMIGLGVGGDDYIIKPFGIGELRARVAALLRDREAANHSADTSLRAQISGEENADQKCSIGNGRTKKNNAWQYSDSVFNFDFEAMCFTAAGDRVELSKTEQRLLRILVTNRGQTLRREYLLARIWPDGTEYVDANALSVTMRRLREKLPGIPVRTVYGIGYVWEERTQEP